jgi:low affinity Fe/Cu permease
MDRAFSWIASRIALDAGRPSAFGTAALLIVGWAVTGPVFNYSDTWQLVVNTATTVVTFLMVFLIQNSQNRDGAAMQAKLYELIRSSGEARIEFIGIEHRSDVEIDRVRNELERSVLDTDPIASPHRSLERLQQRR